MSRLSEIEEAAEACEKEYLPTGDILKYTEYGERLDAFNDLVNPTSALEMAALIRQQHEALKACRPIIDDHASNKKFVDALTNGMGWM